MKNNNKDGFTYNRIREFANSPYGYLSALIWGICEAIFFFIAPDVFFCFIALFSPLIGIMLCLVSVIGSVCGGMIMYALSQSHPQALSDYLARVPGVSAAMISTVHANFQNHGIMALFIGPWQGIPYKIFAVQAGISNVGLIKFALTTIPARLERVLVTSLIFAAIGLTFNKNIKKYPLIWIAVYIIFWIVYYIIYAACMKVFWMS